MAIMDRDQWWRAWIADKRDGAYALSLSRLTKDDLPEGDVLVRVRYSGMNYKDALALTGAGKVIRTFPMVPGIDLAGVVERSRSDQFRPGDTVMLTGWGAGETFWGGYGEYASVRDEHLLPVPAAITARQAMAIGTAGLTAMLCVAALERHGLKPGESIAVTGATGGVGSIAVMLLARRGYRVEAITGKADERETLMRLGASSVLSRDEAISFGQKPLAAERWDGAVDTAGGAVLAGIISSLRYGGAAAVCGNAAGGRLETTVFPLILRGVSLLGIDSVYADNERRREAWNALAAELNMDALESVTTEIAFADVEAHAKLLLNGTFRGRTVIRVEQE